MRPILGFLALASLVAGLVLPVMLFQGSLDDQSYKHYFLITSAAWFIFAISWAAKGKKSRAR